MDVHVEFVQTRDVYETVTQEDPLGGLLFVSALFRVKLLSKIFIQ